MHAELEREKLNPQADIEVSNIDVGISPNEFREIFDNFGCIINCRLTTDAITGASCGKGFV